MLQLELKRLLEVLESECQAHMSGPYFVLMGDITDGFTDCAEICQALCIILSVECCRC